MSIVATPNLARARAELDDRWLIAEQLLAAFCVLMVAVRLKLGGGLVAADPLAWVLFPLWLPVLRRYRGARSLLFIVVLAALSSWFLTQFASADHIVSAKRGNEVIKVLLSFLTSTALVLWAREHLKSSHLFALFGLGLLIAGPSDRALYASNPWKFGFSIPLTIMLVGWFASRERPKVTLGLLAAFAAACMVSDARSNFSVLMLTIVLIAWRLVPRRHTRRDTVWRTLATLGAVAAAAYYGLQAAILDGALGEETAARSQEQVAATGSLLVGGRPEQGASWALMKLRPQGFGGGTFLNTHDLLAAKQGMLALHYDPNNGYVERFMFGQGIELHSMTADLWAWCGILGLVLAGALLVQLLFILGHTLNTRPAEGAVTIFACMLSLWNLAFSPWLASLPLMVLALATGLVRRMPTTRAGARRGPRRMAPDEV